MAVYYFDTSALVKRYVQEVGTAWVANLTNPTAGHDIYTVRLTGPEMVAALARKVRSGGLAPTDARRVLNNFRTDWRVQYQIVEVSPAVANRAMDLAEKHGLRGYDAVHLATALELQDIRRSQGLPPLSFVSADGDQLQAAMAESLSVDDPNSHR